MENGTVQQTMCWLSISPLLQLQLYLVPFASYLTLNNIVTLKSGLEVTQGHSKRWHSKAWMRFLIRFRSNYGRICSRLLDI